MSSQRIFRFLLIAAILCFISNSSNNHAQESLLLGEFKLDELMVPKRIDGAEKSVIYQYKYSRKNKYKDSVLVGIENYTTNGELLIRTSFYGKKQAYVIKKIYTYDKNSRLLTYEITQRTKAGVLGKYTAFEYNEKGQAIEQHTSLANIIYAYLKDGRLSSKAYFYQNKGEIDSDAWFQYFEYDSLKNLIHVDNDTSGNVQTSFYDNQNRLIKHEYYLGVAYSTYKYNDRNDCIRQVDYSRNKRDWDSTVFVFDYDHEGRLIRSSSSAKNGKILKDREWNYNLDGQLTSEILYVKGKPNKRYRYFYSYFTE